MPRSGYRKNSGVEEALETIRESEYSESDIKKALKYLESFPFTTTALWALAHALEELGDDRGADILRSCEDELMQHEAESL